ncbi:hypothetical protein TRFO_05467 [Tritrichomonas foetus]|uniref:Uncharacterized protein n=1 Tax=Tritrichomonas foetus TaxID=1144522 RepID=A0A1J4K5P5_9EUKA|nr:hypothetical protein TRFO_05467 [Tritrichomonas foetus]|eukprot:OHT06777.1 hypothetical protein TRFO_05467 [Tritrichomonas foetus]
MDYEISEAQALDNKRKVMRSNIFGDDEPDPPITFQPKYVNSEPSYNYNETTTFSTPSYQPPNQPSHQPSPSLMSPPSYQSAQGGQSYQVSMPTFQKQAPYAPPLIQDSPIRMPVIDPIEAPQPLPSLTPFPEFRFDTVTPIGSVDLGIRPRESQLRQANVNPVNFTTGDALQRIRDDLMQEAASCSNRLQQIATTTDNFQLNVNPINLPQKQPGTSIIQSPPVQEQPQFSTQSQFMFPDGTLISGS